MARGSLKEKNNRRDRLIGLLRSGDQWTTSKLCLELNISTRTLMRDIQELRESGYPIDADRGRGGGIRLSDRWGIDKLNLDHSEVIDLLVSLAITERLKSPLLGKNLRSIRQKITRTFPPHQREVIRQLRKRILVGDPASASIMSTYSVPSDRLTSMISEGFFERRMLEMEYISGDGERTKRQVEPHFLLLSWPVWYLLCWDHLRDSIRVFRIDRITRCKKLLEKIPQRNHEDFVVPIQRFFEAV